MPAERPSTLDGALRLYAGDDFQFPLEMTDETDAPIDLSGWVFSAAWRKTVNSDTVVPLHVEEVDLPAGKITLVISAEATRAMVANEASASVRGVWDLQGFDGLVTTTFLKGTTTTLKDVTRD